MGSFIMMPLARTWSPITDHAWKEMSQPRPWDAETHNVRLSRRAARRYLDADRCHGALQGFSIQFEKSSLRKNAGLPGTESWIFSWPFRRGEHPQRCKKNQRAYNARVPDLKVSFPPAVPEESIEDRTCSSESYLLSVSGTCCWLALTLLFQKVAGAASTRHAGAPFIYRALTGVVSVVCSQTRKGFL